MKAAFAIIIALFAAANSHYNSGEYGKAVSGYTEIIDKGQASANLYYNLGNACLKKGDVGFAVLNYERAMLFAPRDADLRSNLRAARSVMKQKDPLPFSYFTVKEYFFLAMSAYYVLIFISLIWLFVRGIRKYLRLAFFVSAILLIGVSVPLKNKIFEIEHSGVVTSAVIDAKFEPREDSRTHFPLYDGMKVYILKSREGWRKIRKADGKIGWISANAVEPIVKK